MRFVVVRILACLVVVVGSACSSDSGSKVGDRSGCGISLTARLPGGHQVGLSSCAGLADIQPPTPLSLRVGESVSIRVTSGATGFGPFSTDAPAVLGVRGADTTTPTFVARSTGQAEMYVATQFCTIHNSTVGPCPLASVTVAP